MPHKQFHARGRADDPITFTFEDETFRCVDSMDWPTLEKIIEAQSRKDQAGAMIQIGPFFRNVIVDEDLPRFEGVLSRKTDRLDPEVLASIMEWLVETYSERPTVRPSVSSDGSPATGPNIRVVSLERGTVREEPAPGLEIAASVEEAVSSAGRSPIY